MMNEGGENGARSKYDRVLRVPLLCCLLSTVWLHGNNQSICNQQRGRTGDCEAVETVECVDDGVTGGWISELVYLWVVL